MQKGSNTRSGLLWEVERLLNECDELPQVLLMENVPQVHSKKNMLDFQKWIDFLDSKGYSNYWQDLNARDFGVAQNRNRCFMVSILGDYNFKFPNPIPLKKNMKEYLEDVVEDKYYITSEKAQKLIDTLIMNGKIPTDRQTDRQGNDCDLCTNNPRIIDKANCIKARYDDGISNLQADGSGVVEWNVIAKIRARDETDCIKLTERVDMKNGTNAINKQASKAECRLGNLNGATGGNYAGQIYDKDYLCPTLTDMQGGGRQPHIIEVEKLDIEQQIVAMRGRNSENPSDRTPGAHLEQRLEPNEQGICNCLTSVSKDNMVLEKKSIKIRQATKDGFIDCEIGGVADLEYPSSETRSGRVINKGQICPTLKTDNVPSVIELENPDFYNFIHEIDGELHLIRIRKLTPKECWRLMEFTDEDFHKAEAVNSNTQLYKQAGNSIVENVLVAILGQLFDGKEEVYKNI